MADINQELRTSGLKVTTQRAKVLQYFIDSTDKHLSAYDIHKYLLNEDENISLSTIYRILTQFTAAGLLNKLYLDNEKSVFELARDTEHHDHLICTQCGKIIEFHSEIIEQVQEEIAAGYGFEVTGHTHVLYGKCNDRACK